MNSLEIYQALTAMGFGLDSGKYEPSYASEHALGNGQYLYVKRNGDKPVSQRPLVIHPDAINLRHVIDAIPGLHCGWEKRLSSSYRRFPKNGDKEKYGYDADVDSIDALNALIHIVMDAPPAMPLPEAKKEMKKQMNAPLNQILFGPPGTGKTWATTSLAVRITDPDWYQDAEQKFQGSTLREEVKARYQSLVDKQQIMFTTFHQSFSYEDFVEGIRATTDPVTGNLRYEVMDGIFKQLCVSAEVNVQSDTVQPFPLQGRRIWKMSLGNTMEGEEFIYEECIANNYVLLGWGGDIDFSGCTTLKEVKARIDNEQAKTPESSDYQQVAVNTFKNAMRKGDIIVISDGNSKFRAIAEITGDYHYLPNDERADFHQMRSVNWLKNFAQSLPIEHLFMKSLSQMAIYELRDTTIDRSKLAQLLASPDSAKHRALPHVLIIDEINRGNIARIFGELITLLEPDKRAGASDARDLKLPYSKTSFSVPGNVYIIGTMNTADKSLIQMDLALRRRFSFIEMLPEPTLLSGVNVYGVDIGKLLTRINQRIEALLDNEHMIGHAYFMPLILLTDENEKEQCLAAIFRDKLLPLLREYFFDDYERIGWVLNDSVKAQADRFVLSPEGEEIVNLAALFPSDVVASLSDRRFSINARAFTSALAYQGIVA